MRNAAEHVLEQVTALANQDAGGIDFEVIWVDNGSSDETLQLVSDSIREDDRMRVISAPEVRTSYFARNKGVAVAKGDLVLFCDADDVVDKRWIQSMATALADADVVGGFLKLDVDTPAVAAGPFFGFLPAAPTANLGVRKGAFEAVGGFDGLMRSGGDWAFCWRAQVQGFRFGFGPEAVVLYRRRKTWWARTKQLWTRGRWYGEWAAPFVPLGADAPTIPAAVARIIKYAIRPALRYGPHRDHAHVALWNMAVVSSCMWRPRRPTA
jgi:glycosyltransferase involved in cell wall biosynthesis